VQQGRAMELNKQIKAGGDELESRKMNLNEQMDHLIWFIIDYYKALPSTLDSIDVEFQETSDLLSIIIESEFEDYYK
jgi:hypothetical protein